MSGSNIADDIKELLGQGLSNSVVASAVGCSPSYITQLMEDEEFAREVQLRLAGKAKEGIARDGKWDDLENATLDRLKQVVHLVTRPSDLVRIAGIANNAKRMARELGNTGDITAPIVNLNLPEGAVIKFQMNSQAQVVEIDGRSTAALPTNQLARLLAEKKQKQLENSPNDILDVSPARKSEKKRIESVLESIGFAEDPPEVPQLLRVA